MQKHLLQYFGTTTMEVTKTLVMTYLLIAMAVPAVQAYSNNIKLTPVRPHASLQSKIKIDDISSEFSSSHQNENHFSTKNIIKAAEQDRAHMIWFTYPASIRGQVYFGQRDLGNQMPGMGAGSW